MNRVLVSTTRRHVPATELSGYLYVIDPTSQKVLQRSLMIETPYRELDTNPRGGLRGVKGISIRPDQIAIANSLMIFRYDPAWNLLGTIHHPSCAAVHDIAFDHDTLWVTSARTDILLQFALSGQLLRHYYMRESSPALRKLGWNPPLLMNGADIRNGKIDFRNPLTHNQETYDRAHLNSLCFLSNGDMLVSLGQVIGADYAGFLGINVFVMRLGLWAFVLKINRKLRSLSREAKQLKAQGATAKDTQSGLVIRPGSSQSAVLRISHDGAHELCLVLPGVSAPSHSLLTLPDDRVIYLNTSESAVIHFDPRMGRIISSTKVTGGFLRGACLISENNLLLGSRGELMIFDLSRLEVVSRFQFTQDANESVYDIKLLPENYQLPPLSFEEHFMQLKDYQAGELITGGKPLNRGNA